MLEDKGKVSTDSSIDYILNTFLNTLFTNGFLSTFATQYLQVFTSPYPTQCDKKGRPQHQQLYALLFVITAWVP